MTWFSKARPPPAELGSGTLALNNNGVFGANSSAAIINHPEVAILVVGRNIDKLRVVDGELAVRKVSELNLSVHNRTCDGGTAAGFLRYDADAIEKPGQWWLIFWETWQALVPTFSYDLDEIDDTWPAGYPTLAWHVHMPQNRNGHCALRMVCFVQYGFSSAVA